MARVLVVDDEPHIVKLVSFTLTGRGHEVMTATDGAEGVDMACDTLPDLILMDMMMPEVTGLEALGRLKAREETAGIPVIMLSAKSQGYEQEAGLAAGAVRYVCKPFTPSELAQVVSEVLEQEERGRD